MKRKMLAVLIVCTLALLSVSAATHSILAQVSPYSYQNVELRLPAEFKSGYGWGAKVGYRFHYSEVWEIGADISFSSYKYSTSYLVFSLLAKTGAQIKFSDVLNLDMDFGAGAELRSYKSVSRIYPVFGGYVGLSYAVSPMVDITAGADLRFSWQDNAESALSSNDFNLICNLGVKINL